MPKASQHVLGKLKSNVKLHKLKYLEAIGVIEPEIEAGCSTDYVTLVSYLSAPQLPQVQNGKRGLLGLVIVKTQ